MTFGAWRILHVITTADVGGAETSLLRLLASIDPKLVKPSVLCLRPPGSFEEAYRERAELYSLEMRGLVPRPRALAQLRRVFRQVRPDLVQAWMYHGNLAATAGAFLSGFRGPLIWNIRHSLHSMRLEKRSSRMVIRANAALSRQPDAIIYNARKSMRQHEALGFAGDCSVMIPNGFDGSVFFPRPDLRDEVRAELGLPLAAPVIGMVARYHPMKDPENLLRALARVRASMPDARLVLAGHYTEAEALWAMDAASRSGVADAVMLLGRRPDVPRLLSAFDVVASPSAWGEGFPNALGEALASGIPCVATDIGDSASVVSRFGCIVPPRDSEALADALIRLLSLTPDERRRLGADARAHIMRKYALDCTIKRYSEMYSLFLERRSSRFSATEALRGLDWVRTEAADR